jgi:pentatricopeptide repeat protein
MKMARVSGRRHAMVGTIERRGDKVHVRVEVYDSKTAKPVGKPIEVAGTPQELFDGEGRLAEQIAERIGIKLTDSDRAWLNRRDFRTLNDMMALGRLMTRGAKDYAAQIAQLHEREPDSLAVRSAWLRWTRFKDNDAYLAALEEGHKRFPQEPTFLRWIIERRFANKDAAGSKAAVDEFLKLHPGSWEGLNVRARYYRYMKRDYESSLRAAESMAVLYPDCWMSWERAASEAFKRGNDARGGYFPSELNSSQLAVFSRGMDEALAMGQSAVSLNDKDPDLLTMMIGIYSEHSMPEKSEEMFRKAIAIDPGNMGAYDAFAYVYSRGYQNDEERQVAIIKQSLKAPVKTWWGIQKQAENAFYVLKDRPLGMKLYHKALAAAGNRSCPDLHMSYADAVGEKLGRWEEAEKHARIAVQQNPDFDEWLTLAQALDGLKRYSEAEAAIKQAQKLRPGSNEIDAAFAALYDHMGNTTKGLKLIEKARGKEPREVEYLGEMLDGYLKQGNYDKAWETMQEIKRHPLWRESQIELLDVGDIHALKGQYADAIDYYDLNLTKHPGHVKSLTRGAICYMILGDFKAAATRWQQVIAKHPDHAESHMGLALSLANLKQQNQALAEARKAVALDAHVADPKWLKKNCYWPDEGAQAAAQLAAAARGK